MAVTIHFSYLVIISEYNYTGNLKFEFIITESLIVIITDFMTFLKIFYSL